MRVGEISNLPIECIHRDHDGNWSIKVPLGKLNNERMVPITQKIVDHVEKMKAVVAETMRGRKNTWLIASPWGMQMKPYHLMAGLRELTDDIQSNGQMVTHRLRHTYATEMLSAGMNILVLKDILGHRDVQMTLRYAEVTQEKVRTEYYAALKKLEEQQSFQESILEGISSDEPDFDRSLRDLILEIKKQAKARSISDCHVRQVTKRVNLLRKEIESILA